MSLTRKESMSDQVLCDSRSENIKHQRASPSLSEWLHELCLHDVRSPGQLHLPLSAALILAAAAFVSALTLCAVSSPQRQCRHLNVEPASPFNAHPIEMGQRFFSHNYVSVKPYTYVCFEFPTTHYFQTELKSS